MKPWTELEEKLNEMSRLASSSNCCIYRVPKRLRQENETAYTPQTVCIGPFHHGEPHLEVMEEEKRRYMKEFLRRTNLSVEELYILIGKQEGQLRSCYAEPIKFDGHTLVLIILVDAAFIIELFLRHSFRYLPDTEDRIFGKPYLIQDIWYDMWLLENQIPFSILEEIFNQRKVSAAISEISATLRRSKPQFIELTYEYFKHLEAVNGKLGKLIEERANGVNVEHFTDFLRFCHLPSEEQRKEQEKKNQLKKLNEEFKKEKRKVVTAPSVMQLHNAGAKFKLSESNDSFRINFEKGTLEIPPLKLQLETESLFRNLIAFEQRHCPNNYINDYVFIIHHLANTPKVIELLVEKQIIENWQPDNKGASTLLNNLSQMGQLWILIIFISQVFVKKWKITVQKASTSGGQC